MRPDSKRRRNALSAASCPSRSGLARGGGGPFRVSSDVNEPDPEPLPHRRDHGATNAVDIVVGINQHTAARVLGGNGPKAGPQPLMKFTVKPLETVGTDAAPCRARQPFDDRDIEDQC